MAEPTVPVPVSLIEELREAADAAYKGPNDTDPAMLRLYADKIRRGYPGGGSNLTAAVARVLDVVADALVWEPVAEQPNIEQMVPGTRFTAVIDGGVQRCLFERVNVAPETSVWKVFEPGTGHYWNPAAIDPSTIRDVQPPARREED